MKQTEVKTMIDRMVIGKENAVSAYKEMLSSGKATGEWWINGFSKLVYHIINDPISTKVNIEAVCNGEVVADVCGPMMEFDKVYYELIGRAYTKVINF